MVINLLDEPSRGVSAEQSRGVWQIYVSSFDSTAAAAHLNSDISVLIKSWTCFYPRQYFQFAIFEIFSIGNISNLQYLKYLKYLQYFQFAIFAMFERSETSSISRLPFGSHPFLPHSKSGNFYLVSLQGSLAKTENWVSDVVPPLQWANLCM